MPILRIAAAAALAAGLVVGSTVPAGATLSPQADQTWMTNGVVYSVVRSGDTLYIGGRFTQVSACSPKVSCPGQTVNVLNLAALDATTGAAIPAFHPQVQGTDSIVYALAALGTKLFIGGAFTAVDGTPRRNLAAVDLTTGTLDPSVTARVGVDDGDRIRQMVATGSLVYAVGGFSQIDGHSRKHLAAFEVDGTLDPMWKPRTEGGGTHSIALNCDGTKVIAGGGFREAAGSGGTFQGRFGIAMFDVTTGALDPWAPPTNLPNDAPADDLAANCTQLFIGTGGSNRIISLDLTRSGHLLWMLTMNGNAQAVALRGDRLLVGGHFRWVPDLQTRHSVDRFHFAVVDLNGQLQYEWVPSFSGQIRTGVWDILVSGPQIWVGGGFTNVSGDQHWGIARFTDVP